MHNTNQRAILLTMNVSPDILAEISLKASSLSERLTSLTTNFLTTENERIIIDQRLKHWSQLIADKNENKFQKRLQWDNLDLEKIQPLLGNEKVIANFILPDWIKNLKDLIETSSNFQITSIAAYFPRFPTDINAPLPFEEIWFPTILLARRQLCKRLLISDLSLTEFPFNLISIEAYQSLERLLLQRLVNIGEQVLYEEFCLFRPAIFNGLNLLLEKLNLLAEISSKKSEKINYQAFIESSLKGGLLSLWQKYPVLARLVEKIVTFWIEATSEFIQRLQKDHSVFFQDQDQVQQITHSVSDFHHRGRSVLILTLKSGKKIIYKPKNIGLEIAYQQLLTWCNQKGVLLPFKTLKNYDCQTYGWGLDYVEAKPCADEAAVRRFYERAGMLLCLLYVLGANDCHYENLIAHGEHLVLIDLETLMHPEAKAISGSPQEILNSDRQLWDCVLRTGLLPRWDFSADNRIAYDISGLGSIENQKAPYRSLRWKFINTDEVYILQERGNLKEQKNLPVFQGKIVNPQDYQSYIIDGFTKMYKFLEKNRQELFNNIELQTLLASQPVRFIFRATYVYTHLLQKTLTPQLLQNGVDRSIELDILSRTFLNGEEKTAPWEILKAEIASIEDLDIPYFSTVANSGDLSIGFKSPLSNYLTPGYQGFRERLQKLNDLDLKQQIIIIQGSFATRFPKNSYSYPEPIKSPSEIVTFTSNQFLGVAQKLAEGIHERAIIDQQNQAHWFGLTDANHSNKLQYQPLGYALYEGNCGIALSLSALFSITKNETDRHLALQALQPLKNWLNHSNSALKIKIAQQMGIGGATGISSIIYALVKISQFLEDQTWLEEATRVAELLNVITGEGKLDIIGGEAGAILGLLSLYRETQQTKLLDKARYYGNILIERRITTQSGLKAWKTITEHPLTGFSHGAAGIAYALDQLYEITGDKKYFRIAKEGKDYERAVFCQKNQNWPNFLSNPPNFKVMWCHGATGIGLGRLGTIKIDSAPLILDEVEIALGNNQNYQQKSVDNLCCGNFGRIELSLTAGQILNRPQLIEIARQKATYIVQLAQQNQGYQLFGNVSSIAYHPGFFQGISGIIYQLLRLAYPEQFPVILLWR